MADVITRFKLETTQFDSKLRDSAKNISDLTQHLQIAGKDFDKFAKDHVEVARALGNTASGATNLKQKLGDLVGAYNQAAKAYNNLTKEQQQTDYGKALAESLKQLQGRITQTKNDLNALGDSSKKADGGVEALTSALGLNIKSLVGWGTALGAAKGALDLAKDAFFASEQNLDDWNRMVYSAQSAYEGFLTAINTGDISGFLGRINQITKAAADAYDAMDALSTQKAINNPKIQAQQAENARMQAMIRTKRYIAPLDGRQATMKNGQLLNDEQLKVLEQKLENGMKTLNSYVEKEVAATTRAIEALYNEQASRLGMSKKEFLEGTANYDIFKERLALAKKYEEFEREHTKTYTQTTSSGHAYTTTQRDNVANPYEAFKGWNVFKDDGELFKKINEFINQRAALMAQSYQQQAGTYRAINRLEGIKPGFDKDTDKEKAQKAVNDALLNYQQAIDKAAMELKSGAITEADAKKKNLSAQEALYDAYGKAYATYADPKYKEAQKKAAEEIIKLGGEVKSTSEAQEAQKKAARELEQAQKKAAEEEKKRALLIASWNTASTGAMDSLKKDLMKRQGATAVGSTQFNALQANIVDVSNLQTLINTALKNGLNIDPEIPNMLMKQIVNGKNIDNQVWEELQNQLNERLKEMNIDPLNLNFNTGEAKTGKKSDLMGDSKKLIGGLSEVASGLQQMGIELPKEVQQVLGVIQGVMTVIEGVGTIISIGQTTALTANTIALGALTTAIWANTGMKLLPFMARGGIVPKAAGGYLIGGNSYSGDNVFAGNAWVNSGELVLNKSQQNNLASMITEAESRGHGGNGLARVSGEQIWIALNAYTKRSGKGELLTWK